MRSPEEMQEHKEGLTLILSSDFDDTYHHGDGEISPVVKRAFDFALEEKITCVVTTNRTLEETLTAIRQFLAVNFSASIGQLTKPSEEEKKRILDKINFFMIGPKLSQFKDKIIVSTHYDAFLDNNEYGNYYQKIDNILKLILNRATKLLDKEDGIGLFLTEMRLIVDFFEIVEDESDRSNHEKMGSSEKAKIAPIDEKKELKSKKPPEPRLTREWEQSDAVFKAIKFEKNLKKTIPEAKNRDKSNQFIRMTRNIPGKSRILHLDDSKQINDFYENKSMENFAGKPKDISPTVSVAVIPYTLAHSPEELMDRRPLKILEAVERGLKSKPKVLTSKYVKDRNISHKLDADIKKLESYINMKNMELKSKCQMLKDFFSRSVLFYKKSSQKISAAEKLKNNLGQIKICIIQNKKIEEANLKELTPEDRQSLIEQGKGRRLSLIVESINLTGNYKSLEKYFPEVCLKQGDYISFESMPRSPTPGFGS